MIVFLRFSDVFFCDFSFFINLQDSCKSWEFTIGNPIVKGMYFHKSRLISMFYENGEITEKIVEKSQEHDHCFLVSSQTSKKRTLFFTTRRFGNQDLCWISKNISSAWTIIHFLLPGTVTAVRFHRIEYSF